VRSGTASRRHAETMRLLRSGGGYTGLVGTVSCVCAFLLACCKQGHGVYIRVDSTPSLLIRTRSSTPFASRSTPTARAGYVTVTPLSSQRASSHRQKRSGSICAVVPSRLMTSMVPSCVRRNHSGAPPAPSPSCVTGTASALLVPFSSQSSPLPLMADSLSCESEMPVLGLYPHVAFPLFSSASRL
jgi:hypothetical protein